MNRNEQPAVTHREAWVDLVSILKSVDGVDQQANEILRWIDHHCCIPTSTLVETNRRLNRIRQTQESEIRREERRRLAMSNHLVNECARATRYANRLRDAYDHFHQMDRCYAGCWFCRAKRVIRGLVWRLLFKRG